MSDPVAISAHKNVFVALCAAQNMMGKVVKTTNNPHFNKKYADLSDVVSVALPALNENGIALFHQVVSIEGEKNMRTILKHGESETEVSCDIPLIVAANNMQAMKSATTYAKRIGVESLTGIAPDDDDGNAAASSPPVDKPKSQPKDDAGRKLYTDLVADMRKCEIPADMDAWWKDSECVMLRAKLPADWLENLKGDFAAHKKSLIAKQNEAHQKLQNMSAG